MSKVFIALTPAQKLALSCNMRATNLGFKSPREIFHAPFQIPNVDYYGRTIQTRAKSRSSSQKPRAKTADRFNNQYTRNYSTNCNLSPHSYNPQYGTIAADIKRKAGFRYVEETVDTRTSGFYTYVGDMKIFNPEVISPLHQRLLTPMQTKSKSVDVHTGFNRKNATFINSVMETLEQKVDYEKESLKANAVKPLLLHRYHTPAKKGEDGDGNDTPTTLPQSPSRLELSGLLASHGMNTLSPSTSAASLRSTPRQLLSTPRKNHRNNEQVSSGLRERKHLEIKETDSFNMYYGISPRKELNRNQSSKTLGSESFNASNRSVNASDRSIESATKSSMTLKKITPKKTSKQGLESRFVNPKDNVIVIPVDLQAYTRKLASSKNQKK